MLTRQAVQRRLRSRRVLIDGHTHIGIDPVSYYNGDFPYGISGDDMAVRMKATGVDAAVCFPLIYTTYFQMAACRRGVFRRDPKGISSFPYEFENRRMCREIYDAFPHLAGALLPFGFFDPGRCQQQQADALTALSAEYPLFGIKTATSYLHSFISDLLGKGACLLDAVAQLDIPVLIHSSVTPADPWADVFKILEVVEQRPDVRFMIAHTCRFDRRALDRAAALPNCWVDLSAFHIHSLLARQNHAAVATREHRFPADYRRHAAAMQKIAETYPNTIVWGSDTPAHYFISRFFDANGKERTMSLPCAPETETDELAKLPDALRERITYDNTLRFLFGDAARKPGPRRKRP